MAAKGYADFSAHLYDLLDRGFRPQSLGANMGANTPDRNGRFALWQGGMEPNIPVGSSAGVEAGMAKALAGAEREQREGASGKWVSHWKMVHIVRRVWGDVGQANQLGRQFPALSYSQKDAEDLFGFI